MRFVVTNFSFLLLLMSHSLFQLRDIFSLKVELLQLNSYNFVGVKDDFGLAVLINVVEAESPIS